MSTVTARLHTAATRGTVLNIPTHITLTVEDAQALNTRITNLCPDEETCSGCGTRLCEACGVGEYGCDHDQMAALCVDCTGATCGQCVDDRYQDQQAEAYADATNGRC